MKASNVACMAGVFLAVSAFTAQAGVDIQSAQFKEEKGVLFVKGKADADKVYVVNSNTNRQVGGAIDVRKGDFRADIQLNAFTPVPCAVKIQTNAPSRWGAWGSRGGEYSMSEVRHAPEDCQ